jgi:hypothetical protein
MKDIIVPKGDEMKCAPLEVFVTRQNIDAQHYLENMERDIS